MKQTVFMNWKRSKPSKKVRIAFDGHGNDETKAHYASTHIVEYLNESFTGRVEVTIDVEGIVSDLARKATNNSTGRAASLHGRIKAKIVAAKVVESSTKEVPIPKGYSLFESK